MWLNTMSNEKYRPVSTTTDARLVDKIVAAIEADGISVVVGHSGVDSGSDTDRMYHVMVPAHREQRALRLLNAVSSSAVH